jgi:hypothetical protein
VIGIERAKEFLIDWIIKYLQNRDVMQKKIESIEQGKANCDVYVKYKDKEQFIVCAPMIDKISDIVSKLGDKDKYYTIVTFNNSKNLKSLIDGWKKVVEFKFLNMFFINPFSGLDKKWVIFPYTHNQICDKSSLQRGLKSMFETVEPIIEQEIKKF